MNHGLTINAVAAYQLTEVKSGHVSSHVMKLKGVSSWYSQISSSRRLMTTLMPLTETSSQKCGHTFTCMFIFGTFCTADRH